MTKEELFDVWAPSDGRWSPWVKPVLFACSEGVPAGDEPPPAFDTSELPAEASSALVLDLPGAEGVWAGLAMATRGYRPVPLYNAVPGPTIPVFTSLGMSGSTALVDVAQIVSALRRGGAYLHGTSLFPGSPPAFLLDANRRGEGQFASPGRFDNRSISFTTDFPSATFLVANRIQRVVLIQSGRADPQPDLAHTLRRWQESGVIIELKRLDMRGPSMPLEIPKPSGFGLLWQRALSMLGLRRHGLGGFGGFVPTPSAG